MGWTTLKSLVSARNANFTFKSIDNLTDEFFSIIYCRRMENIDWLVEIESDLISKERETIINVGNLYNIFNRK